MTVSMQGTPPRGHTHIPSSAHTDSQPLGSIEGSGIKGEAMDGSVLGDKKDLAHGGAPTGKLSPYARALIGVLDGNKAHALPVTPKSIERWGLDRPESFVNLIPEESGLKSAVVHLPEAYDKMTEWQLEQELPEPISRVDKRVKIKFWQEYEAAATEFRAINFLAVADGTGCANWGQYEIGLLTNPAKLAWLVRPPAEYNLQMKEAEQTGLKRLIEIMELPIMNEKGVPNIGVAAIILQAFKLVDMRLNGAVTQRMVNVNLNQTVPKEATAISMDTIDAKLKELEDKVGASGSDTGRVIDLEKI